ncbi:MAG: two-component regulator propeller domain-containing protein [Bacteroidales bacterium]
MIVTFGMFSCKDREIPQKIVMHPLMRADTVSTIPSIIHLTEEPDVYSLPAMKETVPLILDEQTITESKTEMIIPRQVKAGEPTISIIGSPETLLPDTSKAIPNTILAGMPSRAEAGEPFVKFENPYSFSFYTRSQGLNQDDISALLQDNDGNIWIGTYGAGIIRYDGTYFSHYDTQSGLPDNHILRLYLDNEGNIWIGTRVGGVIRFDGKYFTVFNDQNGLTNNSVEAILQDRRGYYWFGTYGGGVSRYDGEEFVHFTPDQGLAGDIVYTIEEDDAGNIWFGTRSSGISMFDGDTFTTYTREHGLASNYIVNSLKDSRGRLWFGTNGEGVSVFDGDTFFNYTPAEGLPDSDIISLYEDSRSNIWLGTRRAGIIEFRDDMILNYHEPHGLINTFITSFLEDNSGKMWFGTYGGGLGEYNGDLFRHFTEEDGLHDSFIRTIGQDKDGKLWLGSNSMGLFQFDGEKFYHFSFDQEVNDQRIRSIFSDSNDKLWMGTFGGSLISKYEGSFEFTDIIIDDQGVSITSICEDPFGNLWLGTHGNGIFMLNDEQIINYTSRHGLPDDFIRKVVSDSKGNIWAASREGGIIKFDGEKFSVLDKENGLHDSDFFDLYCDSHDNIWAASNGGGVYVYKDGVYINFTDRHGLGSNFVYSIIEDDQGNMWFGTRMGLSGLLIDQQGLASGWNSFYRYSAAKSGIFFKNYTRNDGFLGIGSNSRSIFQDDSGVLWIGANDILTAFFPDGLNETGKRPEIQITGVGLFNEFLPWADIVNNKDTVLLLSNGVEINKMKFDDVTPWYSLPQNLKLKHNNNHIVFRFVGISTRFSDQIKYQFMLEGIDEHWNALTVRNEVNYGNLSPGRYTFRVRAIDNNGVLSNEQKYDFFIAKPVWQSPVAYMLYVIIITLIIFSVTHHRKVLRHRREQQKIDEMMLQQEVEIAHKSVEFKQNFLANMSHEIRTPLTGILGMAELLGKTKLSDEQKDFLDTLSHSGENLRETINLVLDYSKIEAGKVKLKDECFELSGILNDAEKLFLSIASKKGIEFFAVKDPELPEFVKTDKQRVLQILNNLVSNAVKFTTRGSVGVKISSMDKSSDISHGDSVMIKVEVSDTGKGISEIEQEQLFKPFYQTEQDYNRAFEGTGLGLSISKELSVMLGGDIGLESEPGRGSTFWFTFKAHIADHADTKAVDQDRKTPSEHPEMNILLVEDKEVNQKVVKLMLKGMGHSVTVFDNGKQAVDNYVPGKYDLVLMDIQMPVMDGITATNVLRTKHENLPPIIGLSANAFEGDREKYMNMGMDEYLTKPVKATDFTDILDKLGF